MPALGKVFPYFNKTSWKPPRNPAILNSRTAEASVRQKTGMWHEYVTEWSVGKATNTKYYRHVLAALDNTDVLAMEKDRVLWSQKIGGGADKSLARPGRKQATATELGIYSTYSPRSSIHFLARCSNFYKPLERKSECCPSNQVSAAAMTSESDEKWRTFNCFFSPGNRW